MVEMTSLAEFATACLNKEIAQLTILGPLGEDIDLSLIIPEPFHIHNLARDLQPHQQSA